MSQNALPITVTIGGFVQSEFSCRTNVQREMSPGPNRKQLCEPHTIAALLVLHRQQFPGLSPVTSAGAT